MLRTPPISLLEKKKKKEKHIRLFIDKTFLKQIHDPPFPEGFQRYSFISPLTQNM